MEAASGPPLPISITEDPCPPVPIVNLGGLPLEVSAGRATGSVSVGAQSGPLEATGALFMGARAVVSGIAPVPEPGHAAMLAAGALLLAGHACRRRRAATPPGESTRFRSRYLARNSFDI